MEGIYKKKYTVEINDVDFSKKLKLSSFFVYFQDIATDHAEDLGLGRAHMEDLGVIWVLVRIKLDVIKYPKWNDKITVETWPQQPNRIEFERNFIVYDSDDNIVAKAFSTWVIIDVNNRKLRRSSYIKPNFPMVERDKVLDCQLGKIRAKGELKLSYKKTVGYSDIDMNEHLNNSKYVDYIMDCFSMDQHKNYFIKTIEVDYTHEALPSETIILYTDLSVAENNIVYIEGIGEENNKIIFKSQIEIGSLS